MLTQFQKFEEVHTEIVFMDLSGDESDNEKTLRERDSKAAAERSASKIQNVETPSRNHWTVSTEQYPSRHESEEHDPGFEVYPNPEYRSSEQKTEQISSITHVKARDQANQQCRGEVQDCVLEHRKSKILAEKARESHTLLAEASTSSTLLDLHATEETGHVDRRGVNRQAEHSSTTSDGQTNKESFVAALERLLRAYSPSEDQGEAARKELTSRKRKRNEEGEKIYTAIKSRSELRSGSRELKEQIIAVGSKLMKVRESCEVRLTV